MHLNGSPLRCSRSCRWRPFLFAAGEEATARLLGAAVRYLAAIREL
jgi:hypothetical protein